MQRNTINVSDQSSEAFYLQRIWYYGGSTVPEDDLVFWDQFSRDEESYQFACCGDDHLGNIYEAAWEMYYNRENGRPYDGIRSYEEAIGKTIVGVMADKPEAGEVFYNQGGPEGKRKGNCYKNNLYFILDDGVLVTTIDADLWVDRNAPYVETVDVSDRFRRILGSNINDISFKCGPAIKESKRYTRLVADLIMNNRKTIRFSINFDESDHTDRVTYYSIV